jgi:hypothetical protein
MSTVAGRLSPPKSTMFVTLPGPLELLPLELPLLPPLPPPLDEPLPPPLPEVPPLDEPLLDVPPLDDPLLLVLPPDPPLLPVLDSAPPSPEPPPFLKLPHAPSSATTPSARTSKHEASVNVRTTMATQGYPPGAAKASLASWPSYGHDWAMAIERNNSFHLLLSDDELKLLKLLAEKDGLNASDYLRSVIRQMAGAPPQVANLLHLGAALQQMGLESYLPHARLATKTKKGK